MLLRTLMVICELGKEWLDPNKIPVEEITFFYMPLPFLESPLGKVPRDYKYLPGESTSCFQGGAPI